MASSKALIEKLATSAEMMRGILRDDHLTATVQIADIETICWASIQLIHGIQQSVRDELGDIEND